MNTGLPERTREIVTRGAWAPAETGRLMSCFPTPSLARLCQALYPHVSIPLASLLGTGHAD